jgi:ribonuclease BN (tRNA processing enzyme)
MILCFIIHGHSSADRKKQSPELKKLSLPILATKNALEKLRGDPKARPGHLVKAALQTHLHRDHTFQRPDDVVKAAQMLGVKDFWGKVAEQMPGSPDKGKVIGILNTIANRRNQIVHEANMVRKTRAKKITLREIARSTAQEWCDWSRLLVEAIDKVVDISVSTTP